MEKDAITSALLNELFGKDNFTKCGQNNSFRQYHKHVDKSLKDTYGIENIIPDNAFHPRIVVCFDFEHKFAVGADGIRPVPKENLERITTDLIKFVTYYFEFAFSNKSGKRLKDLITKAKNLNSYDMNLFVNQIINYFITSLNVSRARNDIGTATISLRDSPNASSISRTEAIFFNKLYDILNQLFVPMIPVRIWARGRLYQNYVFPIFDGFLVSANASNSSGFLEVSLSCKDYLELARISHEMINPAVVQVEEYKEQNFLNIYTKPLRGIDHFSIFKAMFTGGKLFVNEELQKTIVLPANSSAHGRHNFTSLGFSEENVVNMRTKRTPIDILHDRFAMRIEDRDPLSWIDSLLWRTKHDKWPRNVVYWGDEITPYRLLQYTTPDVFTSEFSSRLEILRDISANCYYELYVDGAGNIQYHPMRFGNDYLRYPVIDMGFKKREHPFPYAQILSPEEIINSNITFNIEEMVTFLRFRGVDAFVPGLQAELTSGGKSSLIRGVTDDALIKRFGFRRREIQSPMFNFNAELPDKYGKKGKLLDIVAREFLNYANGELYTLNTTTIFRPELEIAMPVLILPDQEVFYVNSISHDITIGESATTTINGSFGRKIDQPALDLSYYIYQTEAIYRINLSGKQWAAFTQSAELIRQSLFGGIPQEKWEESMRSWREKYDKFQKETIAAYKEREKERKRRNARAKRRRQQKKTAMDAAQRLAALAQLNTISKIGQ